MVAHEDHPGHVDENSCQRNSRQKIFIILSSIPEYLIINRIETKTALVRGL